ncbi:hypothetical protein ACWCYY_00440 [Kitasatospora sp. NPDC001664]
MAGSGYVVMVVAGLLFAGIPVVARTVHLRRERAGRRALAEGIEVEAGCVDVFTTRSGPDGGGRGPRQVVLGFRTLEGREVRFQDLSGVPCVVGERVRVRYLAEHPRSAAVTDADPFGGSGRTLLLVVFPLLFGGARLALAGFGAWQWLG